MSNAKAHAFSQKMSADSEIAALRKQVAEKDQRIAELEFELAKYRNALEPTSGELADAG